MSHVTTINLVVNDLDALAKACERLGLQLNPGQKTFKWYGRWMNDYAAKDAAYKHGIKAEDYGKCEHAIVAKDATARTYEIGLIKRADGKGYSLAWDFFGNGFGLCEKIEYDNQTHSAGKLKDWYAAEVAAKQMRKQGFKVTATQQERKVQVLCTK